MKNFKYLLIIVAAVMLFASCSDDGDEQKFTDYSGIYHGIVTSTQVYVLEPEANNEMVHTSKVVIAKSGDKFFVADYDPIEYLTNGATEIRYVAERRDVPDVYGELEYITKISIVKEEMTYSFTQIIYDLDMNVLITTTTAGVLDKQ